MANNENSLADALLLASVEDMSPGSKEAIFQKGRNSLLQKARHLIIDMQEKRCEDCVIIFHFCNVFLHTRCTLYNRGHQDGCSGSVNHPNITTDS
jgi:hypothetical protein